MSDEFRVYGELIKTDALWVDVSVENIEIDGTVELSINNSEDIIEIDIEDFKTWQNTSQAIEKSKIGNPDDSCWLALNELYNKQSLADKESNSERLVDSLKETFRILVSIHS